MIFLHKLFNIEPALAGQLKSAGGPRVGRTALELLYKEKLFYHLTKVFNIIHYSTLICCQ